MNLWCTDGVWRPPAPCASALSLACGTRHARRRHWPTQRRRGVKTMRHIAAGVFQGGCAPAGPALKWRLKILSVIDEFQDDAIGVAAGHSIVAWCIGVLRRRFLDGSSYGKKLCIEVVNVSTAIDVKRQMMQPRRISVVFLLLPGSFRGFECDGKGTPIRIFDGPIRCCRRAFVYWRSAIS